MNDVLLKVTERILDHLNTDFRYVVVFLRRRQ